jgi:hypothetical protein
MYLIASFGFIGQWKREHEYSGAYCATNTAIASTAEATGDSLHQPDKWAGGPSVAALRGCWIRGCLLHARAIDQGGTACYGVHP